MFTLICKDIELLLYQSKHISRLCLRGPCVYDHFSPPSVLMMYTFLYTTRKCALVTVYNSEQM